MERSNKSTCKGPRKFIPIGICLLASSPGSNASLPKDEGQLGASFQVATDFATFARISINSQGKKRRGIPFRLNSSLPRNRIRVLFCSTRVLAWRFRFVASFVRPESTKAWVPINWVHLAHGFSFGSFSWVWDAPTRKGRNLLETKRGPVVPASSRFQGRSFDETSLNEGMGLLRGKRGLKHPGRPRSAECVRVAGVEILRERRPSVLLKANRPFDLLVCLFW